MVPGTKCSKVLDLDQLNSLGHSSSSSRSLTCRITSFSQASIMDLLVSNHGMVDSKIVAISLSTRVLDSHGCLRAKQDPYSSLRIFRRTISKINSSSSRSSSSRSSSRSK